MRTQNILNFYKSVETVVTGLVSLIVNIFMFSVTTLAPLAAPIAPAFSVFKALSERLETPLAIALAGSVAIEITGMFISKTAIRCHNWNSQRNKTGPEAPKGLAIAMAGTFFGVIILLSLTIELNPNLAVFVYPAFVVVAICTYTCLAISNNLTEWEATKANDLEERKAKNGLGAEIKKAKTELMTLGNEIKKLTGERSKLTDDINKRTAQMNLLSSQNEPVDTPDDTNLETDFSKANDTKQSKIDERHQAITSLKNDEPGLSQPAITERLNELGYSVSLSTVKRDIKNLNGSLATNGSVGK